MSMQSNLKKYSTVSLISILKLKPINNKNIALHKITAKKCSCVRHGVGLECHTTNYLKLSTSKKIVGNDMK